MGPRPPDSHWHLWIDHDDGSIGNYMFQFEGAAALGTDLDLLPAGIERSEKWSETSSPLNQHFDRFGVVFDCFGTIFDHYSIVSAPFSIISASFSYRFRFFNVLEKYFSFDVRKFNSQASNRYRLKRSDNVSLSLERRFE